MKLSWSYYLITVCVTDFCVRSSGAEYITSLLPFRKMQYVWVKVSAIMHIPGMFLSTDIRFEQ